MTPTNRNEGNRHGARRKRRLQFGLRFLLVVFTLVILGVAGWKNFVDPQLERDAIRARLKEMGANTLLTLVPLGLPGSLARNVAKSLRNSKSQRRAESALSVMKNFLGRWVN